MKRDYKIWAVIFGIVIAGMGITAFTTSYLSEKGAKTAAYDSAFAGAAAKETAVLTEERSADQEEKAVAGGLDSGAVAEPGDDFNLAAVKDEQAEGAAENGSPEALGELEAADASVTGGTADGPGAGRAATAGRPEAADDIDAEAYDSLSQPDGAGRAAKAASSRMAEAVSESAAPLTDSYVESDQSPITARGQSGAAARSGPGAAPAETSAVLISGKKESVDASDYREKLAEYQKRLGELDEQIQRMRSSETDNTVHSVKSAAQTEQRIWERELDAVYTLLIGSLDEESGKELRAEQQKWILNRDQKAQEASKKNSGGSMESVEYIASIAASTRERVYELVEEYR